MSVSGVYLDEPSVSLNGLQFGAGTPYGVVEFNPFNLRARANSQPRAWNHGAWSGAEWAEEVMVPLVLTVRAERDGPGCLLTPEAEDAWAALQQALSAAWAPIGDRVGESELRFTLGSREYVMFGRPRAVEPDTRNLWRIARTNTRLVFAALDPRKYSVDEVVSSAGLAQQEGGLVVPGYEPASSFPFGLILPGDSGDYASTPDTAALDITGDIDLRGVIRKTASWSVQDYVVSKYDTSIDERSYALSIDSNSVRINWSEDGLSFTGITSSVEVPAQWRSRKVAIRVTMDVDDGSGNYVLRFYYGPSINGPWILLEENVNAAGPTSINSGAADLIVAGINDGTSNVFDGEIYSVQVRDGIDGEIVASPRFDIQDDGVTTFDDSQGNTWTVNGNAEINTPYPHRGGLTVPFTVSGFLVGGVLELVNEGTAPTSLFIRIDGPVVDPRVILQRPDGTVQEIDFFNLTIPSGQWLEINTANGTALLNGLPGSSVRGRAIWDIDPYPLLPGTTTIRFQARDFNEDAMITTTHRSAWW